MPVGITINSLCVLFGGLLGSRFGKYLPARMQESLSLLLGYCSIAIGVTLIPKLNALPAVILALLLGTALGEALELEGRLSAGTTRLKAWVERVAHKEDPENDAFIARFIGVMMLFCTGSTGILGALTEGMTGDRTVMLSKSVMEIFGSASFAASMGIMVALIAVPQFILFLILYFLAGSIMPLTTPSMIGDFMACGGIIAIITGLRICEIKHMRVTNTLPAFLLAMPVSWLWSQIV